ncbi:MFS transporter [Achromobacter sp. K91]|nr:MFS transporter [Achromobacter sp. K91]
MVSPRTRAFSTLLLVEMWERFGYYGMAALMVLFMVGQLGFSDTQANLTWGVFAALVYAMPAVGGWIGDRILGTRRSMVLGALILTVGYFLLAVGGLDESALFTSLGVIVVGNGLFKANAGNLVRQIFADKPEGLDSAFTLYYMAVNVGSTLSMLATPWIQAHWGWREAFAVCLGGLLFGLLNYAFMRRSLAAQGSPADAKPVRLGALLAVLAGGAAVIAAVVFLLEHGDLAADFVYTAGALVLIIFGAMIRKTAGAERGGLTVALILTLQSILFFIFYQQMATSLTLFALHNVDPAFNLFGKHLFDFSAAQFQALNPIIIMLASPPMALLYAWLARRQMDPPVAVKFVLGFVSVAVGFFIFAAGEHLAIAGKVSSWLMVAGYFFYTLGEIFVSALGLAMIARYVPARMTGFMMGSYFIATGVSQYLGSMVANIAHVPESWTEATQTLPIYTHLFNVLGVLAAGCALIAVVLLPFLRRLCARHGMEGQRPAQIDACT